MKVFKWNAEKNEILVKERGIKKYLGKKND